MNNEWTRAKKPLPPPIKPLRGRTYITPPQPNTRLPDWGFWKIKKRVTLREACALALNVDPDPMKRNPSNGLDFLPESFPNIETAQQFYKLLRLLDDNRFDKELFTIIHNDTVMLSEFASWCTPVVRDLIGRDIPHELAARAENAPQATPAANAETVPVTSPSGDDVEEQASVADDPDHDETLAALFNPVPVEALEKMFPAGGKWKSWAEKAASNGLIKSRPKRGMFNPYKAGVWFIRKGAVGWDDDRLYRTLANNLPARSLDNKHLLTGGIG
jgi:hypothetical protein